MKLRTKMILSYLSIAALIAVVSGVSNYGLLKTQNEYDHTIQVSKASVIYLKEIQYYFTGQANDERGYLLTGDDQYKTEITQKSDEIDKRVQKLRGLMHTQQEQALLNKIDDTHTQFTQINLKVIDLRKTGNITGAQELSFNDGRSMRKNLESSFNDLVKLKETAAASDQEFIIQSNKTLGLLNMALAIFAVLFAVGMGILFAQRTSKPVMNVTEVAKRIAEGDLTVELKAVDSKDEIGQLVSHFEKMISNLKKLISQTKQGAQEVANFSEELMASSEQHARAIDEVASSVSHVAGGVEKQNLAINETSASIEEVSASIQEVAANTNYVAEIANRTALSSEEGKKAINNAIRQMNSINNVTTEVHTAIEKLADSSREISVITGVITGIAEQTNLLALNAAIEAARAGDQGRGFAVVAEEVRKLAEQSAEAAKQITHIINGNQDNIDNVVRSMEVGTSDVKRGIEVVDAAGKSFNQIAELVAQVSSSVLQISATTQEMAGGSQQIVASIREIDAISKESSVQAQSVSASTEEQAASVEQITSASQSMAKMAQELQAIVDQFIL